MSQSSDWTISALRDKLESLLLEIPIPPTNIGSQAGSVAAAALVITALVAGLFVLFGMMARKRRKWPFVVGRVLYALDGLLFLLAQE